MTETSYTAWDDKLYQWPPPEGWYEADDGKWWPEGYGPGPAPTEHDQSALGSTDDTGSTVSSGDALDTALGRADEAGAEGVGSSLADATGAVAGSGLADGGEFASFAAGGATDAVKDAFSDAVPDGLAGSVPEGRSDGVDEAGPGVITDALPQGVADAASDHGSFGGDAADVPAALAGDPNAASGRLADALPDLDGAGPDADDVGAALADTMSPRSDGAGESPGSLADAAADATQFLAADLPRPDLDGSVEPPKTDLDALPPPAWTPPSATDGPAVTEAADDLADLAEPASGFSPPATDGVADSGSLFSSPASGLDGAAPVDETLPPPPTGASQPADRAAESFGRPTPDETMMNPLGGSGPASRPVTNPAETGQFDVSSSDADAWSAPPPSHYATTPPPGQGPAGDPGSMPWGPSGAPGVQPMPAGLDQGVLDAPTRSGSSRTLLLVGLGVIALLLLGVAAFLLFGGDEPEDGAAVAQTGPGSLAEPHTRTTPVEVFYPDGDVEQRFVIEVLEPVRDASGEADGEPPSEGDVFAVTRVRVTNQTTAEAPVGDLRFNAVSAAGDLIVRDDNSCTTTQPPLDYSATLGEAGVAEGVVCWVVPAGDLVGLMLGIESTQVGGRIHINLQ